MKNNPFPIKQLKKTDISFDEYGTAHSSLYDDIYAQPQIGLEEKKHVFLKGNNLPKSWDNQKQFTIAETGFGTGLNFVNTWQLWNETRQKDQQLHYISCELHPLNLKQLERSLNPFEVLKPYIKILLKHYPTQLFAGFHRLHFSKHNVTLTLIFADCIDAFSQLTASVDAWFLDGFGPSKNPKMWSKELFTCITRLSHIGTTAATFTVARKIKDQLIDAGFSIKKVKGFGQKREMLTAQLQHKSPEKIKQPWNPVYKATNKRNITVLGAGIAGLTLAYKLQKQGQNVILIDRHPLACQETSGNAQAMIMPSIMLNDCIESQFYLSAFNYAINHYCSKEFHQVGVLQLAITNKEKEWQKKLMSSFDFPINFINMHQKGLLFPLAGWLDTQAHAHKLMQDIQSFMHIEIDRIVFEDSQWHLYSQDYLIKSTDVLVLANGMHTQKLLPNQELNIIPKHGQISYFNTHEASSEIQKTPHVLLNKGYMTPCFKNQHIIGATFDHVEKKHRYLTPKVTADHWQRNVQQWQKTQYHEALKKIKHYDSRAGIRVTTNDHMPICGPLIDQQIFTQDYQDLHHGKHWQYYPQAKAHENLYIFTGLGSRGYTSAPLLAEFLCNQILGQPLILPQNQQNYIHPNRFLYRQLQQRPK